MTHPDNSNAYEKVLELVEKHGMDGMRQVFETVLNESMKIERAEVLQANRYERSEKRLGYANGFKPKTLNTRVGTMRFEIPQVRGGVDFYPSSLQKGLRSERAIKIALAEMYVQGVSTRKVETILKKVCGLSVSSTQVSDAAKTLDEQIGIWKNQEIGRIRFLVLDARYEKCRYQGSVIDCAVLIATGVTFKGKRTILGISVSLSEAEVHWREFLKSLLARKMHGIEMVTSDDHLGIKKALQSCLPSVPWQRCQVHLQRNASEYVSRLERKAEVASDIRCIFQAPNLSEAKRFLEMTVKKHRRNEPKLSTWMEENLPEGFAVFSLPETFRKKMRTTNLVERLNREVARRTKVVGIFPNTESVDRLVSAMLMETDEHWKLEEKRYLVTNGK